LNASCKTADHHFDLDQEGRKGDSNKLSEGSSSTKALRRFPGNVATNNKHLLQRLLRQRGETRNASV